jgi:rod shape-determining protein MreD
MFFYIIIFFLFYLFALLQNSFFVHFNLFGAFPNLVFIFFFLLLFFDKKKSYFNVIIFSLFAGFFLDISSYSYFGESIILLLIIGVLSKKIQSQLQEKENDKFPFVYFLSLFIFSYIVYDLVLNFNLSWVFLPKIIYNVLVAGLVFYVYKKLQIKK